MIEVGQTDLRIIRNDLTIRTTTRGNHLKHAPPSDVYTNSYNSSADNLDMNINSFGTPLLAYEPLVAASALGTILVEGVTRPPARNKCVTAEPRSGKRTRSQAQSSASEDTVEGLPIDLFAFCQDDDDNDLCSDDDYPLSDRIDLQTALNIASKKRGKGVTNSITDYMTSSNSRKISGISTTQTPSKQLVNIPPSLFLIESKDGELFDEQPSDEHTTD
jgi:hypothetical protein